MASGLVGGPDGRPDPGQILIVIHDFKARGADELTLSRGDRVELVERDDDFGDGWYLGRHLLNGTTGLFPEVYTKAAPRGLLQSLSVPRSNPISPPVAGSSPLPLQQPGMSNASANPITMEAKEMDEGKVAETHENQPYLDPIISIPSPNPDPSSEVLPDTVPTGVDDLESILPPVSPVSPLSVSDITEDADQPASIERATTPSIPTIQALSSAAAAHRPGQDSPVMTETLGVIEEHISNMEISRNSGPRERHGVNDSGSEYSATIDPRVSYINGEETDEEEGMLTEAEVSAWNAIKVADYLASVGVEKRHCDVFREQEISGDVLLGMEQSSIFLKEFDLGPVGRRLKTWQRIRELHDEVRGGTPLGMRSSTQTYSTQTYTSEGADEPSRIRSQSHTGSPNHPRMPSVIERSGSRQTTRFSQQQSGRGSTEQPVSPVSPISPTIPLDRNNTMHDRTRRPSAASVRDLHHSRRHSSNDFSANQLTNRLPSGPNSPIRSSAGMTHKKGPSFDQNWVMDNEIPSAPSRPLSTGKAALLGSEEDEPSSDVHITSPWEFDRGYFSGGDIEDRPRNVLRKRGTPTHSRNSSYADEQRARSATSNTRHSRLGSIDSARDPHVSSASQKYYGAAMRRRTPSTNSIVGPPVSQIQEISPTVTKLDGIKPPVDVPASRLKPVVPSWGPTSNGVTASRVPGTRAISEAVTGVEKSRVLSPSDQLSAPLKEEALQSPARTESTASGGPSFEIDSPTSSKAPSSMTTPGSKTNRKKSKKETSAYTRGLEKKTPQEQMIGCDYSGWMKKKSTNLMTTWKPRLFILRGRRLSYYYSENDYQEQGLIDISFHRVLPAENDRLTGLHATLTGATTSPTTPVNSQTETNAAKDAAAEPQSTLSKSQTDQMFIFKLVPPRSGLSRAVNFTKPTVHYFAVPNLIEGRLWMAALMKATIDRDDSKPITTTYQQKTISLAKARAMRHRPPALMNLEEKIEDEPPKSPQPDLTGLNIRGIIFDKEVGEVDRAMSAVTKVEPASIPKTGSSQGIFVGLQPTQVSETLHTDTRSPSSFMKPWMRFPRS